LVGGKREGGREDVKKEKEENCKMKLMSTERRRRRTRGGKKCSLPFKGFLKDQITDFYFVAPYSSLYFSFISLYHHFLEAVFSVSFS
jgi:hypothetical protein